VVGPVVARGAWFGHPENVAACACVLNGYGSDHGRLAGYCQCDHSQLGEQAGPAPIPPGTGAGGTSSGRNTELLVGGAVPAAGAVTGAGAFQHSRTTVSDGVPADIGHTETHCTARHTRPPGALTGDEMTR